MFLLGMVSVPVLSVIKAVTLRRLSKAVASLMRICFWAALPIPTMRAVGVASPIAQGQAMTNTATADIIACGRQVFPPITHHDRNVTRAMQATTGTNINAALSTTRCTGAFDPCASCTIRMICARAVSSPTWRARIRNLP